MKNEFFKEKIKFYKTFRFFLFFLLFFFLIALFGCFHIFSFFLQVLRAFLPFFLGFFLAFLLEPLMHVFEKRMPKLCAVILPFLLLCLLLFLLGILIVPSFLKEGGELIENFPTMIEDMKNSLGKIWPFHENQALKESLFHFMNTLPFQVHYQLENILPSFCNHLFSLLTTSFFSLLIGVYLLYDFSRIKSFLFQKISPIYQKDLHHLFRIVRSSMNRYFLGVFLVMFLVFLTQLIGFLLAGMKSPVFFASICAFTDFIPYIGPYLGGIPCVFIAFSINNTVGIFTLLSILVVQFLENSFYQPYILGKTLYLPPWLILTGILVASSFFGLFGMILVTPLLLILKMIFPFCKDCLEEKRKRRG